MILLFLACGTDPIYRVQCQDMQGVRVFSAECPLSRLQIQALPEGGVRASCVDGRLTGFRVTYASCSAFPKDEGP